MGGGGGGGAQIVFFITSIKDETEQQKLATFPNI